MQTEAGLLIARGTDETGEQLYSFIHRTFQEYFAAMYIYGRSQEEYDESIISDFLKNYVHEPHWHEVILLLLGKPHPKVVTSAFSRKVIDNVV